jgi:hypothetical protein
MGCDGECEVGYDLSLSREKTSATEVREGRKKGKVYLAGFAAVYFTCHLHYTALQDMTLHQAQIFKYMKHNTACTPSHNVQVLGRGTKILDLGG